MISNQKSSKTEIMIMITIPVVAAAADQQQNWEEGEFTERSLLKAEHYVIMHALLPW